MTFEMESKDNKEKQPTTFQYLLSNEFRGWYASLGAEDKLNNWKGHPHFYFNKKFETTDILNNLNAAPKNNLRNIGELGSINPSSDYFLPSGREIQRKLSPFIGRSFIQFLQYMPPITSADLPQSGNKISRLLTLNQRDWFAVIEINDPTKISANLNKLQELTKEFNKQRDGGATLSVIEDRVLLGENGHHFLISPFIGPTLEQSLKDAELTPNFKRNILITLHDFASFCENRRIFWRDLAPRNILIPTGTQNRLVLIDYEYLYKTRDLNSSKRRLLDTDRKIWFGDVLSQKEIDFLFEDYKDRENYTDTKMVSADDLEETIYSKPEISLRERFDLKQQTAFIERLHTYYEVPVFGHRIGRFLTDFTSVRDEAKLYFALGNLDDLTFRKYLYLLQKCIDNDSRNMLADIYGIPHTDSKLTSTFLSDIDKNLTDKTELQKIFDKYDGKSTNSEENNNTYAKQTKSVLKFDYEI